MTLLIIVIVLAFVFDFINGFHDAANSIATVVSTKVLSPLTAVIWAAAFNFVAYWLFDLHVADTVAKTVKGDAITLEVILCGLCGAIVWNLFTWWLGIPSSSSHTLIGGFAGAAIAHTGGFDVVKMDKVGPILYFILLAPLIGMILSYIISIIMMNICKRMNPFKVDKYFRGAQLFSSAAFSLGHGGNDAQKVMGIISAALIIFIKDLETKGMAIPGWATVFQEIDPKTGKMAIKSIPHWVEIGCYTAIGLGTLFGGWRIVKTMGSRITKLTPFEGFNAETAGAITLFSTGGLGIPVSTTHTITGSIIGTGIIKRTSAVRWGVTINLLWAWVLTIPVSGLISAIIYHAYRMFMP